MANKLLICFWGKLKTGEYLRNNPFMENGYYEERSITFQTLIDNYKNQFPNFDIDFLLSTWDDVNLDEYENQLKYIQKHKEPSDWESFLNEKNFPHVSQIRHHPIYHINRPGIYVRLFHMEQISKFLKENNINYDAILFSRTDIYFEIDEKSTIDFTKDICYLPEVYWGSRGHTFVNDHIVMGKYEYVLNAIHIDSIDSMYDTIFHSWNGEQVLFSTLEKNNAVYTEFVCSKYCRFPLHME